MVWFVSKNSFKWPFQGLNVKMATKHNAPTPLTSNQYIYIYTLIHMYLQFYLYVFMCSYVPLRTFFRVVVRPNLGRGGYHTWDWSLRHTLGVLSACLGHGSLGRPLAVTGPMPLCAALSPPSLGVASFGTSTKSLELDGVECNTIQWNALGCGG